MGQGLRHGKLILQVPVDTDLISPTLPPHQEEEKDDEVVLTGADPGKTEGKLSALLPMLAERDIQQRPSMKERVPQIFDKVKERRLTNMKRDELLESDSSKFNHSSDSSFARTFNKLVEESKSLKL